MKKYLSFSDHMLLMNSKLCPTVALYHQNCDFKSEINRKSTKLYCSDINTGLILYNVITQPRVN